MIQEYNLSMDPKSLFQKRFQQYESIFPDFRKHISRNPHITIEMVLEDIQKNPSKKHEWHFDNLCRVISVDTLLEHGFMPKQMELVTPFLINVTIDMLRRTKDTIPWVWWMLVRHKDITMTDIINSPDLPWSIGIGPCCNPNLTHEDILNYPHLFTGYLSVAYLEIGHKVTYEEIKNHPDKPWSTNILSNPTVKTLEQVKHLLTYFKDNTNISRLSIIHTCRNPNLYLQDLLELFGTDVIEYLPYSPNVSFEELLQLDSTNWKKNSHVMDTRIPQEYIMQQLENPEWQKQFYVMHYRIPLDYILKHPEINWEWMDIMNHHKDIPYDVFPKVIPALTEDIIKKGHYTPTEYHLKTIYHNNLHLSLTDQKRIFEDLIRYVEKYPNEQVRDPPPLSNDYLVRSQFFLQPTFQEMREYFAKKKIIRHIVEVLSNPAYHQCRKRLFREYEELPRKRIKSD
jgi:hypothetical protein